tara:strand:- start:84 stop:440 length:357 start_codon:yes stop_codon:yes gene_type:complete
VTRVDLYKTVHQEVGLSLNESAELVEAVLGKIADRLVEGESVKLSSFGTFGVREKKARLGRNPRTGEPAPVSTRRVLVFRASHLLKDRVNQFLSRDISFERESDHKQRAPGRREVTSG